MNLRAATRLGIALALLTSAAGAQVCRLSVAGLNRDRRVIGPVNVECPSPFHSAPFGNWGVTSNFGQKRDGHQFDGWCHDSEVTFNNGESHLECTSDWYQWNSCTDHSDFRAPNCTIYNAENCTQQVSVTGVNVIGTIEVDVPVGCPVDSDGDGVADQGGCSDVRTYSNGVNFMSIYELDPVTPDTLVQSLFYPSIALALDCDPQGCPQTGSQWFPPVAYDDPTDRALVFAEFAMTVNGGVFRDEGRCAGGLASLAQPASAASFSTDVVAPGSIVSLFGRDLSPREQPAVSLPLPSALAGVEVAVVDSEGQSWRARLVFVSPGQINLVLPEDMATGLARLDVLRNSQVVAAGRIEVSDVAPGVFSANASGTGPAAALITRLQPNGAQHVELTFLCDDAGCRSRAVRRGAQRLVLSLFGVGWRGVEGPSDVTVRIGGVLSTVLFAGPQGVFEGLDQLNVEIPLGVEGELSVAVEAGGRIANVTTIRLAR